MLVQVDVTPAVDVLYSDNKFRNAIVEIEDVLKHGTFSTNGYHNEVEHIQVDLHIDEWLRPFITDVYERAGWIVEFKRHGEIMFTIKRPLVEPLVDQEGELVVKGIMDVKLRHPNTPV